MYVEHRISVATPPETIFGIYADVAHWHTWDPDTKSASLDGPFQVGTRGRLTPTEGNAVPMVVTEVVTDRSFTVEAKIPMFRMRFEHELSPHGRSTEVVHRVTFSGLLAPLIGRMLARRLNSGLPRTLANLKRLAERQGHDPASPSGSV